MYQDISQSVILAAGFSSRMGCAKALLPFDRHRTFLSQIVSQHIAAGVKNITVVVNEQLLEMIKSKLTAGLLPKILLAVNSQPEMGRLSSVKTGLETMDTDAAVLLHDVDRPLVSALTLRLLQQKTNDSAYAYPVLGGASGHPILLGKRVVGHILEEKKNRLSLKESLAPFAKIGVETDDPGILANINTPEDYQKYLPNIQNYIQR